MTISSQIKDFHKEDIAAILEEADQKAVDTEQDFEAETSQFEFADGSVLLVGTDFATAYGSK